jgi:hypothetical protein
MAIPPVNRRGSEPSVHTLRRHLRDADEERFRLEAALSAAATDWLRREEIPQAPAGVGRGIGRTAALMVVCTLFFGAVMAWSSRLSPSRGVSDPAPSVKSVSSMPAAPALTVPPPVEPAHATEAVLHTEVASPARTAPSLSRRAVPAPRRIAASRRRSERSRAGAPRPMSPGEFGRRASSIQ